MVLAKSEPRAREKRRKVNAKAAAYAKVRVEVWTRDRGRCRTCGVLCGGALSETHHIKYRSRGGADIASNLVLVCRSCHAAIHARRVVLSGTADELVITRSART